MVFKTETKAERYDRLTKWHRWFAWYPVNWNGGWAWLSFIERRWVFIMWDDGWWEYRPLESKGGP